MLYRYTILDWLYINYIIVDKKTKVSALLRSQEFLK